mgnify:CR=1 FL=1
MPHFQLTHEKKLGLAISYPRPSEIGQDRLANGVGAKVFAGTPAIVIDMGTAVTFDIITRDLGYEGGIIAPLAVPLPGGFTAILMAEMDIVKNAFNDHYRANIPTLIN